MATTLQSFALKKKSFTLQQAMAFAKRHGASKVAEYRHEYKVRVKDPARLRARGFTRFRRIEAAPGVDVVIAAKGRHANAPRGTLGVIPGEVEKVFYHRGGKHPGPYQHTFGKGAVMLAMNNGDVVIRSTRGKRLWVRQ